VEPFTVVRGAAAPLLLPDVNTDVLAPGHSGRADLGAAAFAPLRYRPDGTDDPAFVLNDPRFRGAPILLAGRNFGCGSSREMAVWALARLGVRCVIAPSFGDIFAGNCVQNGLLPVTLDEPTVRTLGDAAAGGGAFTVDLGSCTVTTPDGRVFAFEVDAAWRARLLEGLDDLGATLQHLNDITAYETSDRAHRPWVYDLPSTGAR
jgi:3-isopropylmalate/(R)-2-methylmalate dehydratase small subunit